MRLHRAKEILASVFSLPGAFDACYASTALFFGSSYVRSVNYHGTPPQYAAALEAQLAFYKAYYSNVAFTDLSALLGGERKLDKPGLILSFDDGLRSNYEIAAPLLEKYGFTGWFMIPSNLLSREDGVDPSPIGYDCVWPDGRHMMNEAEIRDLNSRGHVIACHTANHVRLRAELTDDERNLEIRDSKQQLERQLGAPVQCFCWVGGEPWSYSKSAAKTIRDTGYQFAFMTCSGPITTGASSLQLHRTNIEVTYSLPLVRFQLSGAMDLLHWRRRKRVNQLTAV